MHATFDEAEVGEVSIIAPLSNSETSADAHFEAAGRETQCACGKSFAALEANMRIGGHLSVLKGILPRGNFGREVKARLDSIGNGRHGLCSCVRRGLTC